MAYESILTFDLETGTKTHNKRKASKWHPDNYIVADGWKYGDNPVFGNYHEHAEEVKFPDLSNVKIIVGMNIKFDLLWMWEQPEVQEFFKRGGTIWDIQLAEYLIEGQQEWAHMMSLNQMVEQYGGTLKLDAVKEMWDAGIDTPDIPEDLLMKYLLGAKEEGIDGDVNNTWLVFLGQMARIQKEFPPEFLTMVRNRMDSLLGTTEMEDNGLHIDLPLGMELREKVKSQLDELNTELEQYLPKLPPEFEFKWSSNHHRSYLVYGGVAKYQKWVQHTHEETGELLYAKKTEKWPLVGGEAVSPDSLGDQEPDRFKSGKRVGEIKTKNVQVPDKSKPKGAKQDHFIRFRGYTKPDKKWESTLTDGADKPIYSTSADVIKELGTRDIPFLKALASRQKLAKDLGTYYWDEDKNGERKGMLTLVNETDNCIHHSLNHVMTVTGRMSSSNPNLQNIPRKDSSEIKRVFTSRFGADGHIVEIDYSSLEVVVQAMLTHDPQLIKDLNAGVDMHTKRLAFKLKRPYEEIKALVDAEDPEMKLKRTKIKSFTFARAYGAGAVSIAADTGMGVEEVKELINIEEEMYAGLVEFDRNLEEAINASRVPTTQEVYVQGARHTLGKGHWFSPTGTKFVWRESIAPDFLQERGKFVGFKPTERKNYPAQGIGGEIVQTMLGLVWRWLVSKDHFNRKALLINTVHDSIYMDIHKDVLHEVVPVVKTIMEAVPSKYKRDFDIDIPVPFPCEAEVGSCMYDVKHYH